MGYSGSWLAVSGKAPDDVLSALSLKTTGDREEVPESPYLSTMLPKGWFLIVSQKMFEEGIERSISEGCEVISCLVEEHVMVSQATGWKNGRLLWKVYHDGQIGIEHLEVEGEPPIELRAIRDRATSDQQKTSGSASQADYIFDVPVNLAKSITGYRYDEDVVGLKGDVFEVLEKVVILNRKSSLWSRWFGKRHR